MLNILLLLAGLFLASPAQAQNVTCATRPAGDSSNACASTAFVTGSIHVNPQYVTPQDYNGAGSAQTTTGTIGAGDTTLTLATQKDFANLQGILIGGAGPANLAGAPSGISVTPQGTSGGTTYTYKLSGDDGSGGLSAATVGTSTATGNAALGSPNCNLVAWSNGAASAAVHVWRSVSGGAYVYVGYSWLGYITDCGGTQIPPFWAPTLPNASAQAEWLVTRITAGGTTTSLVLANPATTAVTSAYVQHDDSVAMQSAFTAALARSDSIVTGVSWAAGSVPSYFCTPVTLPAGLYNISRTINVGAAFCLNSFGNSTIQMAGSSTNILQSSLATYFALVSNVDFIGGARHINLTGTNGNFSFFTFNNMRSFSSSDYPIQTTTTQSTEVYCTSCSATNTNGFIKSDSDVVHIYGGFQQPDFHTWADNRGWIVQSSAPTYYNQIWDISSVVGSTVAYTGSAYMQKPRWVDATGTVSFNNSFRGGGEFSGFPLVYVTSTLSSATTPQVYQGAQINITDSWTYAGPDAGMTNIGAIVLQGIPAGIDVRGNSGIQPVIVEASGFNFATALAAWKTATGVSDATPYIQYSIDTGSIRHVGSFWPTSVTPYVHVGVVPTDRTAHNFLTAITAGSQVSQAPLVIGDLPAIAANTVVGNATSGSAVPTALSIGSCDTSTKAVQYTTNTGFGCNTAINAATLGGTTFAAPGPIGSGTPGTGAFTTLSASGQITSTQATGTPPFSITSTTLVPNLYVARAVLADSATTNANLTGDVTSIGNATSYNNIVPGAKGGTGVANTGFTITLGGNLTHAGAFATTITATGITNSTLPAGTHTLAGLDVTQTFTAVQRVTSVIDQSPIFLIAGPTNGIRYGTNGAGNGVVEGVDKTGAGSFQPLLIGGSLLSVSINGNVLVSNYDTNGIKIGTPTLNSTTSNLAWGLAAPTISGGFCTSPSVVNNNGTAAFTINVGSACAASAGTITLPTATNGWACSFQDVTSPNANVVGQTGGTTTTVTVSNYARTTGAVANFTSSDVIRAQCTGY